ncbi:MAG: hypothetical protein DI537_33150 [Stutzerimonas stutzeri]|nr:MAG: hypothetical protein DI537_33150 [Stutzerimonas stutzeri]
MPSPIYYERAYNFAPGVPGLQVNNELNSVERSVNGTIDALKDVRRDDGALKNGIVTVDSLSPAVKAILGSSTYLSTVALNIGAIITVAGLAEDIPPLATRVLPTGGTAGQVPIKSSSAEGDSAWGYLPGGGDMLISVYDPQSIEADAFARENHTGAQAISTITGLQDALADLIANAPWFACGVGSLYAVDDTKTGAAIPPTNDARLRFVKLTAGLTGSGGYNQGCLASESVSGSAPLVVATASINLTGSPMLGQTINLINTERRFLRAGTPGATENDQLQDHNHRVEAAIASGGATTTLSRGNAENTGVPFLGISMTFGARVGTETRPKNIGVSYYMRIK